MRWKDERVLFVYLSVEGESRNSNSLNRRLSSSRKLESDFKIEILIRCYLLTYLTLGIGPQTQDSLQEQINFIAENRLYHWVM
jgi:hypothetical protein